MVGCMENSFRIFIVSFLFIFMILLTVVQMSNSQMTDTQIQSGQTVFTEEWFNTFINHINTTFWDSINKGHFIAVDQNANPAITQKSVIDYDSFIELYLAMYQKFNNTIYIERAESLVSYLHKFLYNNDSYLQILSESWQPISNSYFSLPYLTKLLDDYVSLYNVTKNNTYLNEAIKIYNFIYSYFFDKNYWGFFTNLDMNKNPLNGFGRSPGYYMGFAYNLLHLFEVTNNQTYIVNGLDIINNTISLAYQDSLGYFYTFFNGNDNTNPVTNYREYLQMEILSTLLSYLTTDNINLGSNNSTFTKIFYNSLHVLETYGFQNSYVIYSFNQNGNTLDSTEFLSSQIGLLYLYKTMKENSWNMTSFELNVLNKSFDFFVKFYNQKTQLFFTSTSDSTFHFGNNFDALRGIINSQQFFSANADYSVFNINGALSSSSVKSEKSTISTSNGESNNSILPASSLQTINTTPFDTSFLAFSLVLLVIIKKSTRKNKEKRE